ncbi:MAG: hypothetical protein E7302_14360 [Butyrivibrio sp.]|nr:hypothetical protein [Butyrivibrio sp.]
MNKNTAKKGLTLAMATLMGMSVCAGCGNKDTQPEAPVESEVAASEEVVTEETNETVTEETATEEETTETTDDTQETQAEYVEDNVLTTDLMVVTIPDELKGKFYATINGEEISIFDKECVDDGYPGFVCSIIVDKDNEYVPGGMVTKVGELVTSDGNIYNVCRGYASEVQWDYNKYEDMPENYAQLDSAVDSIIENIKGTDSNTFVFQGGMKGEELYSYILSKYVDALNENWDANKFEEEGMSPEFSALAQTEGDKALEKIGYAYTDITNDGIDELLLGVISDTDEPSVVYDIYTVVDRMPELVVSGTARNGYYAMEYGGITNFYLGGAAENGFYSYVVEPNSTNLIFQYGVKYDANTDEKNPWFVTYSDENSWEAMTEEDYNSRIEMASEQYLKLDYTPLSDITPIDYSKVDLSKYDTFTKMLDDFKTGMGYANIPLGDTDVFLASTATYPLVDGQENAIDASLFIYDENGSIVYLGKIEAGGTAYPLAVADGCIYTCGHHSITKSTVKDGKLVKVEEAIEDFDSDGNASYTYQNEDKGLETVEDNSELTRMFDEYEKAEPIEFSVEKQ